MPLSEFTQQFKILGGAVLSCWVIESIDQFILKSALDSLGIRPRQISGLKGILFAPLLHGSFRHLSANTMPFLILGWFVLLDGERTFLIVTSVIWLLGGVGVWFLGRSHSNHIGASGLVFGYLGYVLTRGYLVQSPSSIIIAILAGLFYGGIIWGVLPLKRGSSWEGHLLGLLAGAGSAYYLQDIAASLYLQLGI